MFTTYPLLVGPHTAPASPSSGSHEYVFLSLDKADPMQIVLTRLAENGGALVPGGRGNYSDE